MVQIEKVQTAKALREFINFPRLLYRTDSNWSPPIWIEERDAFTPKNPVLAHSDYELFLARNNGRIEGRILVYEDHNFNSFHGQKLGMFGSFESINNPAVAQRLWEQAERWLTARDIKVIRGPINPVSECWGFLYDGFSRPATFMTPYNPSYYNDYIANSCYTKVKDLFAFEVDSKKGYRIPDRFVEFRKNIMTRLPHIALRRIDMKNLSKDAEAIWLISNKAFRNNWGWVPYSHSEFDTILKKLKPIADPDAIWILEDKGQAVGFTLGFPDLNIILRKIGGRLLPFGFVTLKRELTRIQDFRLFGLAVLPEYHGRGLDVLLYMSLFEALAPRGVYLEASYVLEDNASMINALKKLGMARSKVYRIYEKNIES